MRKYFFVAFSFLLCVSVAIAQSSCDAIVQEALESLDSTCDSVGRNQACYGYNQVEASFLDDVADDFFTTPSDIADIAELASLRTAPLDLEAGVWGVALMNLQANVPNSIPGQNVTFVLMGDVEVENAVDPETAFEPVDSIDVSVQPSAGANIRSGPGTTFNVIGGAQQGDTLLADGQSSDGQWLRVIYRDRPAWISLTVVTVNEADLATLPVLSSDLRTPMQAFYLRTGIGQTGCEELPGDSLFVQGPENIEINLTVNGADVQIGSSGILRIIEIDGEPILENIVFDGVFDWGGVRVGRGQRTRLCLGDADDRGLNGASDDLVVTCDPTPPETVPVDEMEALWCQLEDLPTSLLNYGLDVPCAGETPTPTGSNNGGSGSDSQIAGVDCSRFVIPQQTIIATDFTLNWSDVPGATSYVVAVFDQNNVEVQTFSTVVSSLATNGGLFPSSGYVDVRVYQDGNYACFARLNYNRLADPNDAGPISSANLTIVSCPYLFGAFQWLVTVQWSGLSATDTVTATITDPALFPASDTRTFNGPAGTGTISLMGSTPGTLTVDMSASTGEMISRTCTP